MIVQKFIKVTIKKPNLHDAHHKYSTTPLLHQQTNGDGRTPQTLGNV